VLTRPRLLAILWMLLFSFLSPVGLGWPPNGQVRFSPQAVLTPLHVSAKQTLSLLDKPHLPHPFDREFVGLRLLIPAVPALEVIEVVGELV